ncbi:septum formation family protein [Salinispora cortesiana]|uniref:septum formation family protein n=1 Tax=Salinispora cortesiana TaxID=1305843 RepID=UPI00040E5CE5|nr:septum formation family protein [Salinispora cortesiana]
MKRVTLCATLVTLTLAGCATAPPPGIDGDLVDDWAPIAAATGFAPEAGTCHPTVTKIGHRSSYAPTPCDQPHVVETLHVGTVTGDEATDSTPPEAKSAGMRTAYATCEREVNQALGADWRSGRISLSIVLPSQAGWEGGSRWFRCDVSEEKSLDDPSAVSRTASLAGGLKGDSPLRHTCFEPVLDDDKVSKMKPVACTKKHHAEFVGVWTAPDTDFADFEQDKDQTRGGCLKLIADYAGVPRSDVRYRSGLIYYEPAKEQWLNGNRGVQCFLWIDDRNLTRSMKGAGKAGLPI